MGNYISRYNTTEEAKQCLICWEQININLHNNVQCTRCNIILHNQCCETLLNDKTFCLCPHCQQVGTLYINKCGCYNHRHIK
jgi:hypothetical protein